MCILRLCDVYSSMLYLEEELDDLLQVEAAKRKRSKASLTGECVASRYGVH